MSHRTRTLDPNHFLTVYPPPASLYSSSNPQSTKELGSGRTTTYPPPIHSYVYHRPCHSAQSDPIPPVHPSVSLRYAENTASSLLYLFLELAGVRAGSGPGAAALGHAAGHVGKAVGICTLLRSLALPPPPAALSTGSVGFSETCVLPSDVMRKYLLRHAVLERGPQDEKEAHALAECVFEVASVAKGHIEAAGEGLAAACEETGGKLPAGAFAALLPGVRVAWYLETLQGSGFNAFDESLRPRSPLKFQLRLGRAMISEKF